MSYPILTVPTGKRIMAIMTPADAHGFYIGNNGDLVYRDKQHKKIRIPVEGAISQDYVDIGSGREFSINNISLVGLIRNLPSGPAFDFDPGELVLEQKLEKGGSLFYISDISSAVYSTPEQAVLYWLETQGLFSKNPLDPEPEEHEHLGAFTQHKRQQHKAWREAQSKVFQTLVIVGVV